MTIALVIDQLKPKENMAKTRTFIQWYPMRDGGFNNNCQLSRKRATCSNIFVKNYNGKKYNFIFF